jgi:hypothetical protein
MSPEARPIAKIIPADGFRIRKSCVAPDSRWTMSEPVNGRRVPSTSERPRTAKRFDAEGPVKFGPRPSFVGNAVRVGVFRLRGRR